MDRDGRQGWSRRAERGWDLAFGGHRARRPLPVPKEYVAPGEVMLLAGVPGTWRVTNDYELEEIKDGTAQ